MTYKCPTIILLSTLTLGACAEADSQTESPPAPHTTALQLLQEGTALAFLPEDSSVEIDVSWDRGRESTESSAELGLLGGHIALSADETGSLRILSLDVGIDDLMISHQSLPSDIHLTHISVQLDQAQDCDVSDWSEDRESAHASLLTNMLLHWSMVSTSGEIVELGPQTLVGIPLQLDVQRGGHGIELGLQVDGQGPVWSWLDLVELRNLKLNLGADEVGPIE